MEQKKLQYTFEIKESYQIKFLLELTSRFPQLLALHREDVHLLLNLAINLVAKASNSSVMFMDGLIYVLADIHAQEASREHELTAEVSGQLTALREMIALEDEISRCMKRSRLISNQASPLDALEDSGKVTRTPLTLATERHSHDPRAAEEPVPAHNPRATTAAPIRYPSSLPELPVRPVSTTTRNYLYVPTQLGAPMIVAHAFEGDLAQSQLTLAVGETVKQLTTSATAEGWSWVVTSSGSEGYVPEAYLTPSVDSAATSQPQGPTTTTTAAAAAEPCAAEDGAEYEQVPPVQVQAVASRLAALMRARRRNHSPNSRMPPPPAELPTHLPGYRTFLSFTSRRFWRAPSRIATRWNSLGSMP